MVSWIPSFKWRTECYVNLKYFPFDVQTCDISMVNWAYGASHVNLTIQSEEVILLSYEPSSQWKLLSAKAYEHSLSRGRNSLPVVAFKVVLKRMPVYYIINIVLPIVLMTALSCFVYLVPADSGEKVSLAVTVMLSYSVILLMMSDVSPTTGDSQPIICEYKIYLNIPYIYISPMQPSKLTTICFLPLSHWLQGVLSWRQVGRV